MKLTTEQRSDIISEMASSEAGFNELMRVLLDSFSKQERALFLEEHKGEQGNGFRPRRWRGHGCFSTDHTRHLGCSGKRACAAFS